MVLSQEFEMPAVSNYIDITPDQQYIYACGIYKPRIRCYDVSNLSMKFERCHDAEAVKFHVLSDDYSKVGHPPERPLRRVPRPARQVVPDSYS